MGEFLGGRNDYGLDFGGQAAIGIGNGTLGLEVDHIPYAAHDVAYAQFAAGVDGEVGIFDDPYVGHAGSGTANYFEFLLVGEEAAFVLVDTHGDYDLIEHGEGASKDI